MRCGVRPTAAAGPRLADAVVSASKRRQAAGLHDRCQKEGTEVRREPVELHKHTRGSG